jgi:hypothetical protein
VSGNKLHTIYEHKGGECRIFYIDELQDLLCFLGTVRWPSQPIAGQAMNTDEGKEVIHTELCGWTLYMVTTLNFKENIL